jgi:hypothetical protein
VESTRRKGLDEAESSGEQPEDPAFDAVLFAAGGRGSLLAAFDEFREMKRAS